MPRGTESKNPEKVVFVPLDSRPVSTRLPASLAKLCGWDIVLPPARMLGGLHRQADSSGILDWLTEKALKDAKKLIISTDLLCYGGLVFSRDSKTNTSCAIALIDKMKSLKQEHPKLRFIVFSVILRDSITVRNEEDFKIWKRLSSGKGPYPDWYLAIRARNHEVNRRLIDLVEDDAVDFALFGKEDTAPGNPFGYEMSRLESDIKKRKLTDRAVIINGTDEMPQLLIAHEFCAEAGFQPRLKVDEMAERFLDTTPLFESRPIGKTLKQQVKLAGGKLVKSDKYDTLLLINNPAGKQKDVFTESLKAASGGCAKIPPARGAAYYSALIRKVQDSGGRPVALADLAYANGSDPELVSRLLSEGLFLKPIAYAGWNTASNALGTVIATACVALAVKDGKIPQKRLAKAHLYMLVERLFDDYLYQTRVRPQLAHEFSQPHSLDDPKNAKISLNKKINSDVAVNISPFLTGKNMPSGMLDSAYLALKSIGVRKAALPWARLFEAEIIPDIAFEIIEK